MLLDFIKPLITIVVIVVFFKAYGRFMHSRAVASRSDVIYDGAIRARKRRASGTRFFSPLRTGFGGLYVVVSDHSIETTTGGPFRGVARSVGLERTYDLRRATMWKLSQGGLFGTRWLRDEEIVIRTRDERGELELAIRPNDRDLGRLERALSEAGVAPDYDRRA